MRAAARLPSPLMAATYPTLFGLLAVSGVRIGEAIGLDRDDVDARHGLLRVINSKFGKSREVPLQESVMLALNRYARRDVLSCARGRPATRSSSQPPAPGFRDHTSTVSSLGSGGPSGSNRARRAAAHGCTICATGLPSAP